MLGNLVDEVEEGCAHAAILVEGENGQCVAILNTEVSVLPPFLIVRSQEYVST